MQKILIVFLVLTAGMFGGIRPAAAEEYTIKTMTAEVQAALDARRARFDELTALKAEGSVGETNNGYLKALRTGDTVRAIVDAENKDRKTIYRTIVEQNDLQGALATVERVFAEVQRNKAETGDFIQLEDGTWIQTK